MHSEELLFPYLCAQVAYLMAQYRHANHNRVSSS